MRGKSAIVSAVGLSCRTIYWDLGQAAGVESDGVDG